MALPGCIASEGPSAQLSAGEGSGDLVIHLVVRDGQLARSQAWWAEDAPALATEPDEQPTSWDAIILKNDVVVARQPLMGTPEEATLLWRSSDAGTVAQAGDAFETLVVNGTSGGTLGSYALEIHP